MTIFDLLASQSEARNRVLLVAAPDVQAREQSAADDFEFKIPNQTETRTHQNSMQSQSYVVTQANRYMNPLKSTDQSGSWPSPFEPEEAPHHPVLGEAWCALEVIEQKRSFLNESAYLNVLNAVAAVQKIYYRNMINGDTDPVQERLYARLCRLHVVQQLPAMRHGVSDEELEGMALCLPAKLLVACQIIASRLLQIEAPRTVAAAKPKKSRVHRAPSVQTLSEDILKARQLTGGKKILVVGGICKKTQRQRMAEALGCEVEWREARKGESLDATKLAGSKCNLLISLVKLSSHAHTSCLNALSRETGIPIVRMPGGFSPQVIAREINLQVSRIA